MESFVGTVEKIAEKTVEKTVTFFDVFEESIEVEKSEIAKKSEEIKVFWESLDVTPKNDDKEEQIEKLRQEYMDDLKENSEYPDTIQDDGEPYERISSEENAEKRAEFNANKEMLIKEWENKNGKEWPRYKEDIIVNGKVIRKAGDRYDAHHIHPLSLGGKNTAENITPISAEKHFDKQGVHAHNSPYGKLEKTLQEGK